MSQTITLVQDEIELVNIISISQMRLQKNFTVVKQRLNRHDNKFDQFSNYINQMQKGFFSLLQQKQQKSNIKNQLLQTQIVQLRSQLSILKASHQSLINNVNKNSINIQLIEKKHLDTKMQFQEVFGIVKQDLKGHELRLDDLIKQDQKLDQEIHTKQTKREVQRVIKVMQGIRQKNAIIQGDLKLQQHKLEKMEILSDKAQRQHAKKDIQILRQIDQKIRKQVKMALKNCGINVNTSSLRPSQSTSKNKLFGNSSAENSQVKDQGTQDIDDQSSEEGKQNSHSRGSIKRQFRPSNLIFTMEENDSQIKNLLKTQVDQPITLLKDKIKYLETNYKNISQTLKQIKQQIKKQKNTPDGIKQKIAEIKPELIKLWAKSDTLQDRIAFNQKKIDEKGKIIVQLVNHQKQNNWSKMDEKIKMMQTQFYATIKELKLKVDSKVNCSDYQKFCMVLDEKLKQMNELIFLKSDKIQVKKALLFLQAKIKEIILVISQDEQNQKDALLTKKQIKCISCDKSIQKFSGLVSNTKGNWDSLPWKDHPPQMLGRFGMTSYGSLAKKLKRLDSQDLPILKKKSPNNLSSFNNGGSSP